MSPSELVPFPVVFVTFVGCCSGVAPLAELIGEASSSTYNKTGVVFFIHLDTCTDIGVDVWESSFLGVLIS